MEEWQQMVVDAIAPQWWYQTDIEEVFSEYPQCKVCNEDLGYRNVRSESSVGVETEFMHYAEKHPGETTYLFIKYGLGESFEVRDV